MINWICLFPSNWPDAKWRWPRIPRQSQRRQSCTTKMPKWARLWRRICNDQKSIKSSWTRKRLNMKLASAIWPTWWAKMRSLSPRRMWMWVFLVLLVLIVMSSDCMNCLIVLLRGPSSICSHLEFTIRRRVHCWSHQSKYSPSRWQPNSMKPEDRITVCSTLADPFFIKRYSWVYSSIANFCIINSTWKLTILTFLQDIVEKSNELSAYEDAMAKQNMQPDEALKLYVKKQTNNSVSSAVIFLIISTFISIEILPVQNG